MHRSRGGKNYTTVSSKPVNGNMDEGLDKALHQSRSPNGQKVDEKALEFINHQKLPISSVVCKLRTSVQQEATP